MEIIAEVKTASPFGWRSEKSWDELFEIANGIGHIISVHTDPRWEGSFDLVAKARGLTDKPILAKGIHASDEDLVQAFEAGANYALVVGRLPGVHLERCFIEPNTLEELSELPYDLRAVWNSRDLGAGGLKDETFAQARRLFPGYLCQASNISTTADVYPSADAILIGSHLPEFAAQL